MALVHNFHLLQGRPGVLMTPFESWTKHEDCCFEQLIHRYSTVYLCLRKVSKEAEAWGWAVIVCDLIDSQDYQSNRFD